MIGNYPLALDFFKKSQLHYEHIDKVLKVSNLAIERFYQQVEIALIGFWDQNGSKILVESIRGLQGDQEDMEKPYMEPE